MDYSLTYHTGGQVRGLLDNTRYCIAYRGIGKASKSGGGGAASGGGGAASGGGGAAATGGTRGGDEAEAGMASDADDDAHPGDTADGGNGEESAEEEEEEAAAAGGSTGRVSKAWKYHAGFPPDPSFIFLFLIFNIKVWRSFADRSAVIFFLASRYNLQHTHTYSHLPTPTRTHPPTLTHTSIITRASIATTKRGPYCQGLMTFCPRAGLHSWPSWSP